MKTNIDKSTTAASLEASIAAAKRNGANCAKVIIAGRTVSHVYNLDRVPHLLGNVATVEFGQRAAPGLPMKALASKLADKVLETAAPTNPSSIVAPKELLLQKRVVVEIDVEQVRRVPPETEATALRNLGAALQEAKDQEILKMVLTPAPEVTVVPSPKVKAAPRPHLRRRPGEIPPRSRGTGFMAYIDQLLFDTTPEIVEGYIRSKHSVDEAVRKVCTRFPGKQLASVKRIVKVRPRHLERIKSQDRFNDRQSAPRWRWVGPGHGTGYMRRIDELLSVGPDERKTTKEIAEIVAREFVKDLPTALKVVRMRTSQYRARYGKEASFKRAGKAPRTPSQQQRDREALKAKNLRLFAASNRKKPINTVISVSSLRITKRKLKKGTR